MIHPDPRQNPPTREALSILYDQIERRLEAIAEDLQNGATNAEDLHDEESIWMDLQTQIDIAMEYVK